MQADREANEPIKPAAASLVARRSGPADSIGTSEGGDGAEDDRGRGADGLRMGGSKREDGTDRQATGRVEEGGDNIAMSRGEWELSRKASGRKRAATVEGRARWRVELSHSQMVSAVWRCEAEGGEDEGAPFSNRRMTQWPLVQSRLLRHGSQQTASTQRPADDRHEQPDWWETQRAQPVMCSRRKRDDTSGENEIS